MALRSEDIAHGDGRTRPATDPGVRLIGKAPRRRPNGPALLLAEIDRTRALDRPVFALSPRTGSGYVNYVATETLEYLTRGNCASAAIQYSVLPSALSLGKVHEATTQTPHRASRGIVHRLLAIPPARTEVSTSFGESLGSTGQPGTVRGART